MAAVLAARPFEILLGSQDTDPLTLSIAPSPDETPADRKERVALEAHAKKVSDDIDYEIEQEREQERKAARPIKVLLLGQSESGKSTTLKNFQLVHDPRIFRSQKPSWRAVIQLNIVRSFRTILEAIGRAQKHDSGPPSPTGISTVPRRSPSPKTGHIELSQDILDMKARLEQLIELERSMIGRLTGSANTSVDSEHVANLLGPGPEQTNTLSNAVPNQSPTSPLAINTMRRPRPREVSINSSIPWKEAFNKLLKLPDLRSSFDSENLIDFDDPEDPGHVLFACQQDMIQLWNNHAVRQLLERQKVRLDLGSGFFLDELERVTARRYIPTDDDVLKARLKTLGVSEHKLVFKDVFSNSSLREWRIYDVGGHRSQVLIWNLSAAWVPYFDDMDAIIFLAPISCFDEMLEEDSKLNRLEDSYKLWMMIVSNQLLKSSNLILFLNKIDLLEKKLEAGVHLKDHVVSFGDRPNDVSTVAAYLKRKFSGIMQDKSPLPRVFYCHLTSVVDTLSTKRVILDVRDTLMRQHLDKANLLR